MFIVEQRPSAPKNQGSIILSRVTNPGRCVMLSIPIAGVISLDRKVFTRHGLPSPIYVAHPLLDGIAKLLLRACVGGFK
jgi:hypothetical protein